MKYLLFLTSLFYISCASNKAAYALDDAEIQHYHLSNVDTLLDIGCGSAYFDMQISKNHPELFIVLEDLAVLPHKKAIINVAKENSTSYRVQQTIAFHCREFPEARDKFKLVIGQEDSIPLPSESFDRILCRKTLHEFKQKEKMISEIKRVLRQNGKLTVVEALSTYDGQRDRGCGNLYFAKEEILTMLAPLRLTEESFISDKSGKLHILTFIK